jgi:hypothetical protein
MRRLLRTLELPLEHRRTPAEEQLHFDFTGDEDEMHLLQYYLDLAEKALTPQRHPRPYLISRNEE